MNVKKKKIINYLRTNYKQCGCNKNANFEKIIEKLNLVNMNDIYDEEKLEENLYFDIIRECIYRENINFNSYFSKSTWYSIFSENFFHRCIKCNNLLENVNWNCCDIYCKNCDIKYEVKSKLQLYRRNKYTNVNLGNSLGVYSFLKNQDNYLLIHFLNGYYYCKIEQMKKNPINIILELKDDKKKKSF